jgi:hypothetical protein
MSKPNLTREQGRSQAEAFLATLAEAEGGISPEEAGEGFATEVAHQLSYSALEATTPQQATLYLWGFFSRIGEALALAQLGPFEGVMGVLPPAHGVMPLPLPVCFESANGQWGQGDE